MQSIYQEYTSHFKLVHKVNSALKTAMTKEKNLLSEKLRHIKQDLRLPIEFKEHVGKSLNWGIIHSIFDIMCV